MEEALLPDPPFLVDQSMLHHSDLPSGAAERLQRDREPGTSCFAERDPAACVRRGLVGLVVRGDHRDFLSHRPRERNGVYSVGAIACWSIRSWMRVKRSSQHLGWCL